MNQSKSPLKKIAIIVAAGSGSRMGSTTPKQFLQLKDKPILYYTISTFLKTFTDIQLILVLPQNFTDLGQEIIDAWFDKEKIKITSGGETRFHSVKNGLALVDDDEAIIFVHDGVRCLATPELLKRCFDKAVETGSGIPVVVSRDSVRILSEEGNDPIDRNKVMLVQTPQVFHGKIILPAYNIDYKDRFTDEASVVEAYGIRISLVPGEENNIKITTPLDLLIAEKLLGTS